MRWLKGLLIVGLCAAPMIASATQFNSINTEETSMTRIVNVPEPGTLALLLAGVAGMAVSTRRRRGSKDRD